MGLVNFLTEINKTVDIDKTVNLDVNKQVNSDVQLTGSLATAEASADAIGDPDQGGTGTAVKVERSVDDFLDRELITANAVVGPDPTQSPAPIAVTTDIPGLERTLFIDVLSDEGQADLGVDNPLLGKLAFDQGDNTFSNAYADYGLAGGGSFDPFEDADNADILADFAANFNAAALPDVCAALEDVCYTYKFEDIDWDPGQSADGAPATLRVSLIVEDSDGDIAIQTVLFVPGEDGTGFGGPGDADGLELCGSVAGLIDETLVSGLNGQFIAGDAATGGIVALGTEDDVDGNGSSVDFNDLSGFQILLEDDPTVAVGTNTFSSGDEFILNSVVAETPSVSGSDASVADFSFTTCEFQNEYGFLAEVDTFAQVEEGGAFAFSESLAALSEADFLLA